MKGGKKNESGRKPNVVRAQVAGVSSSMFCEKHGAM